jgi:hypothetical protein
MKSAHTTSRRPSVQDTISIELGDHNAVADANKTPADLVPVAPKSEGPAWRLQPVQSAPSGRELGSVDPAVFADQDAAHVWFVEHDRAGVAFESCDRDAQPNKAAIRAKAAGIIATTDRARAALFRAATAR